MKGNECMKSKDYSEAVNCYSKSIALFQDESATYSNRALAYIKTREFARAVEDANTALTLDPTYIKAYHRRGKAYQALSKLELAIKDFQFILEKEPGNKAVISDLKDCRQKLNQ